ncbi:MAG TPA: CGNR zinc finger domain-containing protein [Solirubrobacterales bacterium]|nr:CGNR zinc finger domain-containing protein [Solirubrobacterales bacterium]
MNVDLMTEQAEGKPAPLPLLAVQAFANTLDVEDSMDHLETPEAFAAWLRDTELGTGGIRVDVRELAGARRLRDAVRRLLVANTRGTTDEAAGRALARLAQTYRVQLAVDPTGKLEPDVSPATKAEQLVPQLLGIIFYAQATGTWERLKLCENPECLWAFYDNSRNRSGSWCRMGLCGNRIKNRAYRERQRGSGASAGAAAGPAS